MQEEQNKNIEKPQIIYKINFVSLYKFIRKYILKKK